MTEFVVSTSNYLSQLILSICVSHLQEQLKIIEFDGTELAPLLKLCDIVWVKNQGFETLNNR